MKKFACLTLALVMLASLAACGGGAQPSASVQVPSADIPNTYNPMPTSGGAASEAPKDGEGPQRGGVVRWIDLGTNGGTSEPFGLVWTPVVAKSYSTPWSEALVNYTQDGKYEPWLAKDWKVDKETSTITFYLREGIKFTDGSPFNAEAVAWNINQWHIDGKGDDAINRACDLDGRLAEAVDEYTVNVPYNTWGSVLFETFASHSYSMVSMQNFLDNGRDYAMSHPVGTGPFKLSEWVPGSYIKFVRNEDYWQEGKPYLDGVEYHEMTDLMTQNAAVLADADAEGAIDIFQCSNAEQAYTLISKGAGFDASYARSSGTMVVAPSSDPKFSPNSPFLDLKVRQAVAFAIDRDVMVEAKGFGIWKPAYQITAAGFAGHLPDDNPNLVSYNPEKAKELMKEAGYENGFDTTIYANVAQQDVVMILQDQLAAIGIRCTPEFPEAGRMNEIHRAGWDGLYVFNFGQVMNTGISYFIWYNPDQKNYVSIERPVDYEAKYTEARMAYDIDNELFGRLGNLLLEHMYMVPLYHQATTYFIRNGLKDANNAGWSSDTIWSPWDAYWEAGSPRLTSK